MQGLETLGAREIEQSIKHTDTHTHTHTHRYACIHVYAKNARTHTYTHTLHAHVCSEMGEPAVGTCFNKLEAFKRQRIDDPMD